MSGPSIARFGGHLDRSDDLRESGASRQGEQAVTPLEVVGSRKLRGKDYEKALRVC